MSSHRPLLGAHVSVAGGLYKGIENAKDLGAETIQFFGSSPRQWFTKMPNHEEVGRYKTALQQSDVKEVYLHAAYLVNLASPLVESRKKSVKSLSEHLAIANAVRAQGLIFHIGSGKEMPKEEAIDICVSEMKHVLENAPGNAWLVMENSAGSGKKLASTAQEIGLLLKRLKSSRVKVCFDTAHAFEGGTIESYTPKNIVKLFDEWDAYVGCENIVALHVNDSKSAFNSHYDRHENLGRGHIGLSGFQNLAREKRLYHAAWILEVPGMNNEGPDKKNLDILKACFRKG